MSSTVVRSNFRTALDSQLAREEQYIDSIAMYADPENLPERFLSLEFLGATEDRIGLGTPTCWRERGTCRIWVAGLAGSGDNAVTSRADQVKDYFRNWGVPAMQLRTVGITPPTQLNFRSSGRWFSVVVDVTFQRDFFT